MRWVCSETEEIGRACSTGRATGARIAAMTVVTAAMTEVTGAMTEVMTEVTGARTAATVAPDPGCSASPTATGERVWRRYAHLFEEARLAPNVAMVEAIETARASVGVSGVRPLFAQDPSRGLRVAGQNAENPLT